MDFVRETGIFESKPELERDRNGMLQQATWVWRKRGIVSSGSAYKITSYVARSKCVYAPPAPSPGTLYAVYFIPFLLSRPAYTQNKTPAATP